MDILNYKEQNAASWCKAIFDLYLPKIGLTFRNLKLCQGKAGHHFVGFPSFPNANEDPNGKKTYTSYYEFSQEKQKLFQTQILEALKPYIQSRVG